MSLDYDLRKCSGLQDWDNPNKDPIINSIIWATMFVHMGEITEANAEEFFHRLNIWQEIQCALIHRDDGAPYYLTLDDVKRLIGLKVNVITKTRRQWEAYMKGVAFNKIVEAAAYRLRESVHA